MTKFPVKIIEFLDGDKKIQEVMIDLVDSMQIDVDPGKEIEQFRDKYFDLVKQARNILPKEKSKRKPSHFWQIGKLLYDFNKSIENDFEITNYHDAIKRDFGPYRKRQIGLILQFGKEFKKADISDSISFSHYVELIWHTNMLKKLGLFTQEKNNLIKMAKNNTLPNSHKYSKELDELTKSLQRRKIKKKKDI